MKRNAKSEPAAAQRGPGRPPKPTLPPPTPEETAAYVRQARTWQKDEAALRVWVDESLMVQAQVLHARAVADPGQVGILAHREFVSLAASILGKAEADPKQKKVGAAALLN